MRALKSKKSEAQPGPSFVENHKMCHSGTLIWGMLVRTKKAYGRNYTFTQNVQIRLGSKASSGTELGRYIED